MCKYSIIMPVYNAADFLKRSIESVINQKYSNWELIIVDDGSTDNSSKIIKEYIQKDDRIKYYFEENKGPGIARNYAISKCEGSYVAFLDADDYLYENFLSLIDEKKSDNESDIIFYGVFVKNENEKINNISLYDKYLDYTKEEIIRTMINGNFSWGVYNKVVKKSIIEKCEFSNLPVGEEIIFTFNVLLYSKTIDFLNQPVYHHIFNSNGQHKKGGIDPWKPVIEVIEEYLKKIGIYEKFSRELNLLAVKALIIATYRIFCEHNFKESKQIIKNKTEYYNEKYNILQCDYKKLTKTNKILFFLIKHKFYFLLCLVSKIKNIGVKKC